MTKLDGNERWKTKMLMTEHVDQYAEEEKEAASSNKILTVEECTMNSSILQRAYVMAGEAIQRRIMQDTYWLQKELKQRSV